MWHSLSSESSHSCFIVAAFFFNPVFFWWGTSFSQWPSRGWIRLRCGFWYHKPWSHLLFPLFPGSTPGFGPSFLFHEFQKKKKKPTSYSLFIVSWGLFDSCSPPPHLTCSASSDTKYLAESRITRNIPVYQPRHVSSPTRWPSATAFGTWRSILAFSCAGDRWSTFSACEVHTVHGSWLMESFELPSYSDDQLSELLWLFLITPLNLLNKTCLSASKKDMAHRTRAKNLKEAGGASPSCPSTTVLQLWHLFGNKDYYTYANWL